MKKYGWFLLIPLVVLGAYFLARGISAGRPAETTVPETTPPETLLEKLQRNFSGVEVISYAYGEEDSLIWLAAAVYEPAGKTNKCRVSIVSETGTGLIGVGSEKACFLSGTKIEFVSPDTVSVILWEPDENLAREYRIRHELRESQPHFTLYNWPEGEPTE